MAHQRDDDNSGQMSTDTHATIAAKHVEGKEAACSSSSSDINEEDDFFQIEGPILGTQFSMGTPAEGPTRSLDECPDPKRIPSSVFTRSKSSTPSDWSVTSNESLFSINVGNASFSKDHLFLYGKSGEMGNPNDPLAPLPPLPKQSPGSSPIKGEVAPKATGEDSSVMKPDALREKGDGDTDYINSSSHRSDGSTTSFAFPILTGDERSSGCSKENHPDFARQSTAQVSPPAEPHEAKNGTPKAVMEAPKVEEAPVPEPAPAAVPHRPPATTKWFPWCSCCPFCC